jgi:hypothetical protein
MTDDDRSHYIATLVSVLSQRYPWHAFTRGDARDMLIDLGLGPEEVEEVLHAALAAGLVVEVGGQLRRRGGPRS